MFHDREKMDWTNHAADAMRMLAVAWREENGSVKPQKMLRPDQIPLNELWKQQLKPRDTHY
jgi:hypothetical protein